MLTVILTTFRRFVFLEEVGAGSQIRNADDDMSNYITDAGERVRSKSELVIANLLYKNNIPYMYECPLKINNNTVYPDFTV